MGIHLGLLPRNDRYLGYAVAYYDGRIQSFGFWFFHVYLMDRA